MFFEILIRDELYIELMPQGTVFVGSNSKYYGDIDLWEHFESGIWNPCCWDSESGEEWIRTDDNELLHLKPVDPSLLPPNTQIEQLNDGIRIVSNRQLENNR